MGYYDHGPLVDLTRPLALIGFLGSDAPAIAQLTASWLGLPFAEVDRLVEHQVGASRSEFARRAGLAALREEEIAATERALKDRPFGLIALSDGNLLDEPILKRVLEETDLVYIERPFDQILERLRARAERLSDELPAQAPNPDFHLEELENLFKAREPGYLRAPCRIAAEGRHVQEIARELIRLRGWPFAGE